MTNNTLVTIGCNNSDREKNDFYATAPIAIDKLKEVFDIPNVVYEPCCGMGHLSKRLEELGHKVYSTDLIDRGYGIGGIDFLNIDKMPYEDCNCILTNPPFRYATEMILKSLDLLSDGGLCIMFLRTIFLEGKKRYEELFSQYPPKYIFQFCSRCPCAKNGDFEFQKKSGGSAVAFSWWVWEKGFKGDTIVRWIH